MSFFKYILFPFALIYQAITSVRNIFYSLGIFRSKSFGVPVIGIGNLSTGGTGKTPMSEYVLQLLLDAGYKPALLSRGYGRKTKGFVLANSIITAEQIGDEPYQIYRKFAEVVVAVCEDRVNGIKNIFLNTKGVNIIVLDDCFQHRKLKADYYILLTDYNHPYYEDHMLPVGNLRENISGRKRANMIVMTKCPYVNTELPRAHLINALKPFPYQSVFFTGLKYFPIVSALNEKISLSDISSYAILGFSGIANPQPFINYIKSNAYQYHHLSFSDHHDYSEKELENIFIEFEKLPEPKLILTTEKDWRRIEDLIDFMRVKNKNIPHKKHIYFLPVGMKWDAMEKRSFDLKILDNVRKNSRKL